jgi:Putative prokaryotic signal transducing protein
MSDRLVEVAAFGTEVEAHAARGLLEAEGIKTMVTGVESTSVWGGVQGVGKIALHVAEPDAERAVGILAAAVADRESDDGPREGDAFWLCPLCGDAVADDWSVCPACETPRPPDVKSEAVVPAAPRDSTSQDIQEEPIWTFPTRKRFSATTWCGGRSSRPGSASWSPTRCGCWVGSPSTPARSARG